jgi:CRISPR-associated protein (TIGR02710 family)
LSGDRTDIEAGAKAARPVFLICTVGGSPQPIATALRLLRPAAAWFLVSDGKTGKSSRSQVEEREIDYDSTGKRGPGLKFAEGCPADIRIIPTPADDPDGAYKICRSQLMEASRRFPDHRLVADYTGGTKSMTGALLMAAFAEKGFEVQFMAGERPDLVQVKAGSEKPRRMVPDFILAERSFAEAELAVEAFDYAAAHLLLDELRRRLSTMETQPPKAWRRRLEQAVAWTALMAKWDAFEHSEAASRAKNDSAMARMLDASGHYQPLVALASGKKDKPDFRICADLWLNALRRAERARYDDAVARLYRLLEATAQAQLWSRYGLQSGKMPPPELPEWMRSPGLLRLDEKEGKEYARLGLDKTVEFLRHRDPNDPLVAAYGRGGRQHGPEWLASRNQSILAHGFRCATSRGWKAAHDWTKANLVPFFAANPLQLPRQIPLLSPGAPG